MPLVYHEINGYNNMFIWWKLHNFWHVNKSASNFDNCILQNMMHIVHINHLSSMLSNATASYEWFRTASIMPAIHNEFVMQQ